MIALRIIAVEDAREILLRDAGPRSITAITAGRRCRCEAGLLRPAGSIPLDRVPGAVSIK
jgi:hypothetical protein